MSAEPIRMISSMATRAVLSELIAAFADGAAMQAVQLESAGGVDVARRVQAGEACDVVVLASGAIDQLISDGRLLAASRVDLVKSGMAVAIGKGGPRPDIGSGEAVRKAVLAARSLGYSTGPSGNHLIKLFERWGIMQSIASRIVQAPAGVSVATLVARGDVEMGFQQLSELLHVPGVEVLGPLPDDIQSITTFCAAVCDRLHARAAGSCAARLPCRTASRRRQAPPRHGAGLTVIVHHTRGTSMASGSRAHCGGRA